MAKCRRTCADALDTSRCAESPSHMVPAIAMDVGRASDATCFGSRIRLWKSALTQASGSIRTREWIPRKFADKLGYGQLAAPNTATTG